MLRLREPSRRTCGRLAIHKHNTCLYWNACGDLEIRNSSSYAICTSLGQRRPLASYLERLEFRISNTPMAIHKQNTCLTGIPA